MIMKSSCPNNNIEAIKKIQAQYMQEYEQLKQQNNIPDKHTDNSRLNELYNVKITKWTF